MNNPRADGWSETKLKAALVETIRARIPSAIVFRHEDKLTHGIPDISITGYKKTIWIEAKFANPGFKSRGIQELTMRRLARAGYAFYVVWEINVLNQAFTYIVPTQEIGASTGSWENFRAGFDHRFITDYISEVMDYDYERS